MLYELHFKGLLCRLLGESRDRHVEHRALYGLSCRGLAAALLLRGPIAPGPTSPAAEGEVDVALSSPAQGPRAVVGLSLSCTQLLAKPWQGDGAGPHKRKEEVGV